MSTFAFVDATTWVNGYDFTTDLNQVSLSLTAEELDNTTFGSGGYRSRIGGLKTVSAQLGGFWQSATSAAVDPQAFPDLGVPDRVVTIAPDDAVGTTAYFFHGGKFTYELFGQIGEVTPFSLGMTGTNRVGAVRGRVAAVTQTVSATGGLTGVDLGNASSGQTVYASLHVFSAGTTITVLVERDDAANFPSPTTVATIGPITTTGGTWSATSTIASTNNFYRFNVSAITGAFQIAGAIGIGS